MESWRSVKDYERLYQVSNLGRVRSLKRKTLGRWGRLKTSGGGLLKPSKINSGYLRVDLSKNGKAPHYLVHRLVAFAFIPEVKGKGYINHKNSNREDNRVENLEWCTHQENKEVDYCPQGHEYTKGNSYYNTNGGLECLICKRKRGSVYMQNLRTKKKFILSDNEGELIE